MPPSLTSLKFPLGTLLAFEVSETGSGYSALNARLTNFATSLTVLDHDFNSSTGAAYPWTG
jgi:hypothetical protein